MPTSSIEKNVEEQLMSKRRCRRRPGEVPYPLEYTKSMLNYDNWDHMFLVSCCRSLTMHQFDKPPPVVLDVGCGGGYWAIEAAKQWTSSTVIGFDILDNQPRLVAIDGLRDLARRVKWVRGNLLDGLPFPPCHFDFVRIVGIGLGVPEDEWQYVLEEVARVMKPGAVLEIIEEDLIFPCAELPPPRSRPRPAPISVDFPPCESLSSAYSDQSSATLLSDRSFFSFDDRYDTFAKHSTLPSNKSSPKSPTSIYLSQSPYSTHPPVSLHPRPSTAMDYDSTPHPQDHSRLKSAWDAMLSRRFLAPQLLAVLPFYLSSSFVDIQTHPPLKVPLPPNSGSLQRARRDSDDSASFTSESETFFDLKPSSTRGLIIPDNHSVRTCKSAQAIPTGASMHLAKTFRTVVACKEAIWEEYERTFSENDSMPFVTRTTRAEDVHAQSSKPSYRENFEAEWTNWENDMTDRIAMRRCITSQLAWSEPAGERPDWRVWRSALDGRKGSVSLDSDDDSLAPSDSQDLCRSLRGFVGWKPSST